MIGPIPTGTSKTDKEAFPCYAVPERRLPAAISTAFCTTSIRHRRYAK